jgi:hypothetical protein
MSNSPAPAPSVTPARHAFRGNLGVSLIDDELRLYTVEECAVICKRSPRTIRNLLSRFQLPRKTAWVVRNRHRQRCISLKPSVVLWLRRITFEGDREAFKMPPR